MEDVRPREQDRLASRMFSMCFAALWHHPVYQLLMPDDLLTMIDHLA